MNETTENELTASQMFFQKADMLLVDKVQSITGKNNFHPQMRFSDVTDQAVKIIDGQVVIDYKTLTVIFFQYLSSYVELKKNGNLGFSLWKVIYDIPMTITNCRIIYINKKINEEVKRLEWKYLDDNNPDGENNIRKKMAETYQVMISKFKDPQNDRMLRYYGIDKFMDEFLLYSILDPIFSNFSEDIKPLVKLYDERKRKFNV